MSSNSRRVRSIERAVREGLELVGADLDLARRDGAPRRAASAWRRRRSDGLDARDELLGVARLGHPVVGAEPQPAHALGDGRLAGADDDRQRGQLGRDPLEVLPRVRPEQREVDDERAEAHRDEASTGTAPASTRCSHPSRSRRLVSTCRKPESVSMTATRSEASVRQWFVPHGAAECTAAAADDRGPRRSGSRQVHNRISRKMRA